MSSSRSPPRHSACLTTPRQHSVGALSPGSRGNAWMELRELGADDHEADASARSAVWIGFFWRLLRHEELGAQAWQRPWLRGGHPDRTPPGTQPYVRKLTVRQPNRLLSAHELLHRTSGHLRFEQRKVSASPPTWAIGILRRNLRNQDKSDRSLTYFDDRDITVDNNTKALK